MTESSAMQIGLARLYVKDISFESPRAPEIFRAAWRPEIKLDVAIHTRRAQENLFEVTLSLTIEAKEGEEVGFIVEVEQAGLFEVRGAQATDLDRILQVFCAGTLFPYARQVVDQQLLQGGFPPLMLAPINFEALFQQQQAQKKQPVS